MVLLDTGTPGTSREIYREDADGETRIRNPWITKSSALAIELYSSKAIAEKELSLSSWCIASLYIYHFSTVIDFSSEKYSVLLDTGTPGTSREIYREDADGEIRTRNPWITKPSALAIELYSSKAIAGKELSLSSW